MTTAKLGRKPHGDPPVKWNINLPTTLAAEVELLLTDPLTGVPEYGKRSKLIQELLYGWVEKYRRQPLTQPQDTPIIPPGSPTSSEQTS